MTTISFLLAVNLIAADPAPATPGAAAGPVRIADTQVTIRAEHAKGQATVVAIAGDRLTIVTAAHFLSADDVDHGVLVARGPVSLPGRVASVARNPHFDLAPGDRSSESAGKSIGVDTAVATIRVEPRNEDERRTLAGIHAATITVAPFPGGAGQIVPVHIVDQFGVEHVVRAGNHLNPKCLAWGRSTYEPQHGDSGAGVFVLLRTAEGEARPVLIGNVSQTDDRGGIASLTSRSARWMGQALAGDAAAGRSARDAYGPSAGR